MNTPSAAGYPRKFAFWVEVLALVALGAVWSRFVGEGYRIEWPRIAWAALALIEKILMGW